VRDELTPNEKILMTVQNPVSSLKRGTALEATGLFVPDRKNPGNWMLVGKGEEDIRILTRSDSEEDDPGGRIFSEEEGTRGTDISKDPDLSIIRLQTQPGGDNKFQPKSPRSNERSPLPDELKTARAFSVSGLIIFYVLGAYVRVKGKANRR